ncbi:hypothetical protein BD770DRAFT_412927 [Pilaira anomala]|nr:hypothetical protein BD770DRAFT_412927 [Pilaira anomala]
MEVVILQEFVARYINLRLFCSSRKKNKLDVIHYFSLFCYEKRRQIIFGGRIYHDVDSSQLIKLPRETKTNNYDYTGVKPTLLLNIYLTGTITLIQNFLSQVNDYISFEKGIDCLLDILGRCRPGAFLLDMAQDYPIPSVSLSLLWSIKVSNASFSLGNVVQGLYFPDHSFDYIPVSYVSLWIPLKKSEWPLSFEGNSKAFKVRRNSLKFSFFLGYTGNESCIKVVFRAVEAGMKHIVTEETRIDLGPNTGNTMRWSQSCTAMAPRLDIQPEKLTSIFGR